MKKSAQTPVIWTLFACGLLAVCPSIVFAGPKVSVGRSVPAGQLVSMDQIDHSSWDGLLKRYVDNDGSVNYASWKQSIEDRQTLEAYLAMLSTADPRARVSREVTLAFWINAYNAVTIQGILREYPTTSIRNHTATLYGYNIWDDLLLTVGGRGFSLNQIEHEVLRKLGEPRIHFAIVCASRSCPRLLNEAYRAETLNAQLTANTKVFFANTGNFQYDQGRRQMRLSSILKWFGDDFGNDQAARLRAIAPYLPTSEASQAANAGSVSVSYLPYDWGLNEATSVRAARR